MFGEDRYFKVHLDWGQQFAFRFDTATVDGLGILDGVQTNVFATNPVRQELGDVSSQSDTHEPFLGSTVTQLAGSTTAPARWTNRESSDSDIADYSLDGDYFLVFTAGYDTDRTSTNVPYTLTVEVTGDKEQGPQYAQRVDPSKSSTTGPTDAGSNGASNNGASNTGASGNGSSQLSDSEPAGWTTGQTTLVGGSIGVAVLAAIMIGWLVLGRRHKPRPAAPPIMPPTGRGPDWS